VGEFEGRGCGGGVLEHRGCSGGVFEGTGGGHCQGPSKLGKQEYVSQ
jgi:hypothetical protein